MNFLETIPAVDSAHVIDTNANSPTGFIQANTMDITLNNLRKGYIIPVFSKDNESIISHQEFISSVYDVVQSYFNYEAVLKPGIKVSHLVKGRIPEAMGKPASMLQDHEVTQYFERLAFMVEVPSVQSNVNGNMLSLVVGGVRALNTENLYSRKSLEKFKLFIGFQNHVCLNLCVSTDGLLSELRVGGLDALESAAFDLLRRFDVKQQLDLLRDFQSYSISERQFAQLIGRLRMFSHLPSGERKGIPELSLTDAQINMVVKGFYSDSNHSGQDNNISLWNLYNLFTGSNKSSYIDKFLERGKNAFEFISVLKGILDGGEESWYLT